MTPDTAHPTKLSDDELAALRASDPAAFDDDVPEPEARVATPEPADEDEAKLAAGDTAVETPAAEVAVETPADPAKPDQPTMIPKARLDEVIAERNEMRDRLAAAEAKAAQVQPAAPERDFDTELSAMDQQYDDGDFEGTFAEFQKAREAVVVERTRAEMAARAAVEAEQRAEQTAAQQWDAAKAEFFALPENASLVDGKIKTAAFVAALEEAASEGITDNVALLSAARAKIAGVVSPAAPVNPHAERDAVIAANASRAGNTPPAINGGVGNRSNDAGVVDLDQIKPGNFSKLPVAEQEKLLGTGGV